jgi:hypothetical protein
MEQQMLCMGHAFLEQRFTRSCVTRAKIWRDQRGWSMCANRSGVSPGGIHRH